MTDASAQTATPESTDHHKYGVVIAGLDRPEMINEVLDTYPVGPTGFSVRLFILEPDQATAQAAIASGQVTESSRVRIYSGEHCVTAFLEDCSNRPDCIPPRHLIASGQARISTAQAAAAGLNELTKAYEAETLELGNRLEERWADRGFSHWQSRFAQIRAGEKARVLVITSRFSTFIRHTAQDLVHSFTTLGHDARTLMEPDTHTPVCPTLSLRAIDDFDPDFIVVINYPRSMRAEMFPDGWAHVCWVQDAMQHLFTNSSKPTQMDFVAGHIFHDTSMVAGYPAESLLPFPVPISETKFHPGPTDETHREQFACDIAYVSHQSETADSFHNRIISQFPAGQHADFVRCRAELETIADSWHAGSQHDEINQSLETLIRGLGKSEQPNIRSILLTQYINPIIERLLRHETLEWAAKIAEKHGLTLKIFGNGWDAHPSLSQYAHGSVEHGDDLRNSYQNAGVHLHVSMSGIGHQRVFECMLSGGLALSRRSWNELHIQDWIQINEFIDRKLPHDASILGWNEPVYAIENHPQLRDAMEYRSRLIPPPTGWDHQYFERIYAEFGTDNVHPIKEVPLTVYTHIQTDPNFNYYKAPLPSKALRPVEILGDPLELTFSTKQDLEDRILHAINDRAWRSQISNEVAQRARDQISMDQFATSLLDLVANKLSAPISKPVMESTI